MILAFPASFSLADVAAQIRFELLIGLSRNSSSLNAEHVAAVIAGTEEPNDALLAALCLVRQPDGTYVITED